MLGFKTSIGSVKYAPELDCIIWSIKQFQGGKEYLMRAHFGLASVTSEDNDKKKPIAVKFEIPYFTVSGIQVIHTLRRIELTLHVISGAVFEDY